MNKKDLTRKVAEKVSVSLKDANLLIGAVLEGIAEGLGEDGKVTLVNFGTFKAVAKKARTARNPKTGEPVEVPAKVVPGFKAGKGLKEAVAGFEFSDEPEADEPEADEPEADEAA